MWIDIVTGKYFIGEGVDGLEGLIRTVGISKDDPKYDTRLRQFCARTIGEEQDRIGYAAPN